MKAIKQTYGVAACYYTICWRGVRSDVRVGLPFDDENLSKLIDKIVLAQFEFPPFFSNEAKDLISGILVSNPNKRPSLAQIKGHAWFMSTKSQSGNPGVKAGPRASSKELADLNPDEYVPAKMNAFEYASYCTGKLLNNFFDIKDPQAAERELPTEILTKLGRKEYLAIVLACLTLDISCNSKN
eukprot:TRINITY_DN12221_c0_g1_i2.p1 TRINITY_DN12221_c0_g1~~TRINITY_DN12221_c0_g1_i2.p1  ORF type:complete len:184 (-),score=44.50 TRINITY_DN12221_c0_g1_i2:326-877(-)